MIVYSYPKNPREGECVLKKGERLKGVIKDPQKKTEHAHPIDLCLGHTVGVRSGRGEYPASPRK